MTTAVPRCFLALGGFVRRVSAGVGGNAQSRHSSAIKDAPLREKEEIIESKPPQKTTRGADMICPMRSVCVYIPGWISAVAPLAARLRL